VDDLRLERIRERARQLWEQAGSPQGRDEEFWYEAENQIDKDDKDAKIPDQQRIPDPRR
jgi:hypothetical protein